MKSRIGLEHIRSNSEGRITHTLPGIAEETPPEAAGNKTLATADPSELVAVVVHMEKDALDVFMEKTHR